MAAPLLSMGATLMAVSAPTPAFKNFLLIAVDDLRPMFGKSFGVEEVLTPNLDKHFLEGGGSAMQHSYVQIAVCGPSRASILTGRRPDSTTVGVAGGAAVNKWCWCQRTDCSEGELFMTLPTYFAQHGFVTAGNGKIFHPDACTQMHVGRNYGPEFSHVLGDDARGWTYGPYGVEGMLEQPFAPQAEQFSEEQFGTIPGPNFPQFNGTVGPSWLRSNVTDEHQPDGQLATNTIERLANFSRDGVGKADGKPFFIATGFHKPHTPWIVPSKYFDLYNIDSISLPPNPRVPTDFKEENWHANGNVEIEHYTNDQVPFGPDVFGFNEPVNNQTAKELRLAYFAATSFLDASVGRVLDALEQYGYADNTVVAMWSDHGYHLGDTNSWCKMTNFEKATRNTLFWRVPGQSAASQGRNNRYVEMVDFFPTAIELMGLPTIPKCTGRDQPPTVLCLQGESYADEFVPSQAVAPASAPKQAAFSQWPYPVLQSPGEKFFRMGYTVRSTDGYRYTAYVPYSITKYVGVWANLTGSDDAELYDYTTDPNETTNQVNNPKYADVVTRLHSLLRAQFA